MEESPGMQPPPGGELHHGGPPDGLDDVGDNRDIGPIDEATDGGPEDARDPLRFSNWIKRSATGAVMTGIAMGLQQALEPQNRDVPFVIEAKGEPDDPDRAIDLRFDPDSPEDTVAVIRRPATAEPPVS